MIRRLPLPAALAALVCAVSAGPAAASALYNQSNQTSAPLEINVYFSCGVFCSNDWNIEPGSSVSRPGKGGSFQIMGWPLSPIDAECENPDAHPDLQSHGWAQFTYDPNAQPPPGTGTTKYLWQIFGSNSNKVGNYPVMVDSDACY